MVLGFKGLSSPGLVLGGTWFGRFFGDIGGLDSLEELKGSNSKDISMV